MKVLRKIIEIDEKLCNGCGKCVLSCAEGAIEIIEGKAKVVLDKYCDGLGACLGECPEGALHIVEREADEFDEDAVVDHLSLKKDEIAMKDEPLPCQCPSTVVSDFSSETPVDENSQHENSSGVQSSLMHWPVQIMLIPPGASFLKNADLLVASDCSPVACPDFHTVFMCGKAVMIGCPKFDDQEIYREKFTAIFKNSNIKSVTLLLMEVPCCNGMLNILNNAMSDSGKKIPLEVITISTKGKVLSRKNIEPRDI